MSILCHRFYSVLTGRISFRMACFLNTFAISLSCGSYSIEGECPSRQEDGIYLFVNFYTVMGLQRCSPPQLIHMFVFFSISAYFLLWIMEKDGKKHCIYQEKRKHLYVSSGLIIKACHLFMCLIKLRQDRIKIIIIRALVC